MKIYPKKFLFGQVTLIFALAWFALSPTARAVDPPPDGGYPGRNTAEGDNALFNLTSGIGNTANGASALENNTTGTQNTATGVGAIQNNTTGSYNTACGSGALFEDQTGIDNTAIGDGALGNEFGGNYNTATGSGALSQNPFVGDGNTANGFEALTNSASSYNTGIGYFALAGLSAENPPGGNNSASGAFALISNDAGSNNTANGYSALYSNLDGANNTANGSTALFSNTRGNINTADGHNALSSNTTGSDNIGLGNNAGSNLTTGSHNIDIGNLGVAGEGNAIRIGTKPKHKNTFIAGINGVTVPGGVGVIIDASGHLGTATSSARFKDEIRPMDKASEAIFDLKPVTFHYRHELDPNDIPQFGLVAEDVEKVNPALVARDADGKPYTVRYEAVNAMLLNEFLKAHRKSEKLEATVAHQQKQIEALTAGLQKVSAQIELSKPAPRTVLNNH
jgi:trimeric autotransporter adhesin